ncbi:MAG: two-component regulator propeller domain-containing protein, partial [Pseudomonadota bacterium]
MDRILCLLLCLLPALVSAQAGPMFTRQLEVADGLSQNTVFATLQDRQGFVWIATEQGLNRYDGYELRQFHRSDSDVSGLPDSFVYDLAEDADGRIWFATARGGLAYWVPELGRIERVALTDRVGEAVLALRALHVDSDNRLWIGTRGAGLLRLDLATLTQAPLPRADAPSHIYDFAPARNGDLWIGSDSGVYRWRAANDVLTAATAAGADTGLRSARIRSLLVDDYDMLWAGTLGGGLHRYLALSQRFEPVDTMDDGRGARPRYPPRPPTPRHSVDPRENLGHGEGAVEAATPPAPQPPPQGGTARKVSAGRGCGAGRHPTGPPPT